MGKIYGTVSLKSVFVVCFLGGLLLSCSSSSKISDSYSKLLDDLVSSKYFEIESDRVFPLATASLNSISNAGLLPPGSSAGQISLIGNPNYLKVLGDSVVTYLPYYGERQMGGGYDSNGGRIEFEGIPNDMDITKDKENQRYTIQFKMKDDSENFNVNITLFPNLTSIISVNSSQRFPIRYTGSVKSIQNDE